ncbi:hypothetical protein THAOC_13034 [Thalassiosira oceanica]|uniref:Uncharacterized protein n=1 Tax=Thalassiosira oceanica TaxID=159749 RepID=K0SIM0_THAOC|nr:hypothetical protein THAOC_13034 [Thalassiosira oceanica]|eukprot:EJK66063.1 hypothetical protein THAOC_13034 [Thalassiosira oceanica]
MCCGRRAIPMALRPPLSIKRAGATANSLIIERARPACRGRLPEPLITSFLQKPAATVPTAEVGCGIELKLAASASEVRCGIELSLCSTACPSIGDHQRSMPPSGPISVLGSLAAPRAAHLCRLAVGLPFICSDFCRSDDAAAAAGMNSSISSLLMLPTAIRWRLVVVDHIVEQFTSP